MNYTSRSLCSGSRTGRGCEESMSQTSRVHTGDYRLLLNVSTPCTPVRIMAGILLFRGVTAQIMPASHPANLELLTVKLGMKKVSPLSGTIGGGEESSQNLRACARKARRSEAHCCFWRLLSLRSLPSSWLSFHPRNLGHTRTR